jgi:hypothetical protein
MTYLKDLIDIRDHVGRGDFVLRLSEGVTDPVGTVKHYQVTPPLVKKQIPSISDPMALSGASRRKQIPSIQPDPPCSPLPRCLP